MIALKRYWYSSGKRIPLNNKLTYASLLAYENMLALGRKSFQKFLAYDLELRLFWMPQDLVNHHLRLMRNILNLEVNVMAVKRSTFVYNNLSKEELKKLDTNYPDADAVENQLAGAIIAGCQFHIQADRDGGYIVFCNQGNYATTGRSGSVLDALVVALFKFGQCGGDLSSAAQEQAQTRRG